MSVEEEAQRAFDVPLLRFLGARFSGWENGAARLVLSVGPESLNANDRVHGGTLCALLDLAAYLAVLPSLEPGQTAVTHNVNVSFLSSSPMGAELRFEGRVLQRGRSLAFVQSEAHAGDRLVAVATVCKTILVLR